MASNTLREIAQLIDELRSDDSRKRLNSAESLEVIGKALGPERTRNELIPFLCESSDDDDDILVALCGSLGNFVNYVGGSNYALVLIKPLEPLVCAEETMVRDKVNYYMI